MSSDLQFIGVNPSNDEFTAKYKFDYCQTNDDSDKINTCSQYFDDSSFR